MKTALFPFLLFLLCCSTDPAEAPKKQAPVLLPRDSTVGFRPVVPRKLPLNLPAVQKFPGCDYQKAVAYKLTGRNPRDYALAVFQEQTGEKVELTQAQVSAFLNLINNRKNYGADEKSCFEPRIGLVFYDTMEKPVAYLSLCLHCYNLVSEPRLDLGLKKISHTGFSEKMHRQLEQLFAHWGLPDE